MEERPGAAVMRAIVAADMVGSTALRASVGDERADRLLHDYAELVRAAVSAHGGVIRRWMGDGMTATFPSASAAVAASLALQRSVATYGRRADAVSAFAVRIGLSAGEVRFDEADQEEHGIAVVEAARLERLAGSGEIVATRLARQLAGRNVRAGFEDLGELTLKGLDDPVAAVRVIDLDPLQAARPLPASITIDERFPLVGRGGDVERAEACWRDVTAGQAGAVLVSGQPGMGKTRFVSRLCQLAHDDRALVLAGACDPDVSGPYQAFVTALTEIADVDADLAAAVADGAGPLGTLFPHRWAGREAPDGTTRQQLFEAVTALFETLAVAQPVVLVLEDLHWAAHPSVQLLRHLVRHLDRSRVLLVGTFRAEDIPLAHPLHELLAETAGSSTTVRINLAPLATADVAELIAARVPDAPAPHVGRFAQRVVDDSGGNPFFVCELLHHLAATGELQRLVDSSGVERLPIPDSVRGVVSQRLTRTSPELGDLLTTAAVMGQSFGLRLLAHLGDRPLHHVVELLEEAERSALVFEVDAGQFAFTHAIVRSTMLDRLSATRRALAHARVAEALETLEPNRHDQLAHHWRQAGADDQAVAHLRLAAERDLETFAFESAADRFQQLIDHYRPDTTDSVRCWLGLGLARRALGQLDYLDAVLEAGRRARRLRDHDLLAEAALATRWPGTYFMVNDAGAAILELGEDAVETLADHDPRRARILATLAVHDRDPAQTERFLSSAYLAADTAGDASVRGQVLVSDYISRWSPDTVTQRAELLEELVRLARSTGHPDLEFYARFFGACHATECADLFTARRRLRLLHAELRFSFNSYFQFLAQRLEISIDLYTGQGDQGRVDELAKRFDSSFADTSNTWAVQTAELARQQGRLGSLEPAIEAVLATSDLSDVWAPALGLARLANGKRAGAQQVLDDYQLQRVDHFWLASVMSAAELAVELGDAGRARELITSLSPYRGQLAMAGPGSMCFGLVTAMLGRLAATVGDEAGAVELLTGAMAQADELGAPFEAVRARRCLAELRSGRADGRAEASRLLATAWEVAERHGFDGERDLLARLAAEVAAS